MSRSRSCSCNPLSLQALRKRLNDVFVTLFFFIFIFASEIVIRIRYFLSGLFLNESFTDGERRMKLSAVVIKCKARGHGTLQTEEDLLTKSMKLSNQTDVYLTEVVASNRLFLEIGWISLKHRKRAVPKIAFESLLMLSGNASQLALAQRRKFLFLLLR